MAKNISNVDDKENLNISYENELIMQFLKDENMARNLSNADDKENQTSDSKLSSPRFQDPEPRLQALFRIQSSPGSSNSSDSSTHCSSQMKTKKASPKSVWKVGSTGVRYFSDYVQSDEVRNRKNAKNFVEAKPSSSNKKKSDLHLDIFFGEPVVRTKTDHELNQKNI